MSYVAVSQSVSQEKKASAEKLFDQGETIAAIARQLDVSRRTIERWADDGAWREKRGVIPIGEAKKKAKPQPLQPSPASTHNNPPSIRAWRRGESIDELEIVDTAIACLSVLLGGTVGLSACDDRPIDTRGIGGTAGALVRLLEYRRKICPPTAAELADQVIALGISPAEFVAELKQKWQLQQRA